LKKKQPKGIRRIATGWQAYIRIAGRFRSKVFPLATSIGHMRRWREDQRVRHRLGAALPPPTAGELGSTLIEDIAAYLEQVATMPTLAWRKADLLLWIHALGADRDRRSITAGEIRAQLERWRAAGYAANTVNHRRTALMHLWTVLDGRSAPNPARDVPRYTDDSKDAPPRALSPAALAAVFAEMGESQTRARLELMRWTGWPQKQMARMEPGAIRWDEAVYVLPRRKGRGAAGVWLPLLPQAWAALREFKRLGCWGPFSTSSARKSFALAARKARRTLAAAYARRTIDRAEARRLRLELLSVTPYQLRHSFLTLIAATTQDDRAVQTLAQHADIRQTHRYTKATADPRAAAALAKVAQELQNGGNDT